MEGTNYDKRISSVYCYYR